MAESQATTVQPAHRRSPVTGTATGSSKKRKLFLVDLYGTAVGKKYVMALTGIAMMGFVLAHMIGNLKMYLGEEDLNHYAEFLTRLAYPLAPENTVLWIMRAGLIGALLLHIHAAYSLTVMNRQARSVKYQSARDYQVANFASRTMRFTGVTVLLFLIWHILDFTLGVTNTLGDGDFNKHEVYANVVRSFERVPVSVFYILANLALGVHLYHGAWSLFQSIGWNSPRFNQWRRIFATAFAAIIVVGNVSFPIAVLAGVVG
jgi:succinate dehydrogenase / fumarate reductase, cytochrome b subunit